MSVAYLFLSEEELERVNRLKEWLEEQRKERKFFQPPDRILEGFEKGAFQPTFDYKSAGKTFYVSVVYSPNLKQVEFLLIDPSQSRQSNAISRYIEIDRLLQELVSRGAHLEELDRLIVHLEARIEQIRSRGLK